MMTIEELDLQLKNPNIEVSEDRLADETFSRIRKFKVRGTEYRIEWWSNVSYLFAGDAMVVFDAVRQEGTWPNNAKTNLQFYDARGDVCCIIPIENYKETP